MIQEFYSNIWIKKDDMLLRSYVNGVGMVIDEKLLARLFHLNDSGRQCSGQEFRRETLEGLATLLNIDFLV